jgi:hypothetical protein
VEACVRAFTDRPDPAFTLEKIMLTRFLATTVTATGFLVLPAAAAVVAPGNGNAGFGGAVGNGTLTVDADATDLTLTLDTGGAGLGGNILAIYFDTVAGGFADTSALSDSTDGGRRALSGFNANGDGPDDDTRTLATFAPGFEADFGLALGDGFASIFDLETGGNDSLIFLDNQTPAGSPASISFDPALLGLSVGDTFTFVGTLISDTAFRSDETFGAATFDGNASGNPGFAGGVTFSESFSATVIPEPTSALAVGASGLLMLGRRRR